MAATLLRVTEMGRRNAARLQSAVGRRVVAVSRAQGRGAAQLWRGVSPSNAGACAPAPTRSLLLAHFSRPIFAPVFRPQPISPSKSQFGIHWSARTASEVPSGKR